MGDGTDIAAKVELAHDLLKPIGVIATLASRLPRELDHAERAQRDARRLLSISRDLVALLRAVLQEGVRPAAAESAVEAAVRAVGLRHPERKIELTRAPGLQKLGAEPVVVRRVVENLLDNALAASPPWRSVSVRMASEHGAFQIEVVDAGRGFAEEGGGQHPSDRPEFVHEASGGSGHGIGLPASRRAVEAMGGSLTLLRFEGRTLARVVLPAPEDPVESEPA